MSNYRLFRSGGGCRQERFPIFSYQVTFQDVQDATYECLWFPDKNKALSITCSQEKVYNTWYEDKECTKVINSEERKYYECSDGFEKGINRVTWDVVMYPPHDKGPGFETMLLPTSSFFSDAWNSGWSSFDGLELLTRLKNYFKNLVLRVFFGTDGF